MQEPGEMKHGGFRPCPAALSHVSIDAQGRAGPVLVPASRSGVAPDCALSAAGRRSMAVRAARGLEQLEMLRAVGS